MYKNAQKFCIYKIPRKPFSPMAGTLNDTNVKDE